MKKKVACEAEFINEYLDITNFVINEYGVKCTYDTLADAFFNSYDI